jgi:hypothetical protein
MEKAKESVALSKSKKEDKILRLSSALKNNLLRRKSKSKPRKQESQKEIT